MPSLTSISAQPITPRPTRRIADVILSISSTGYSFISRTLSKKWIAVWMVSFNPSQSMLLSSLTNFERLTEFKVSYGMGFFDFFDNWIEINFPGGELLVGFNFLHEFFIDSNRNVEIGQG